MEDGMTPERFQRQFNNFLVVTQDARQLAERDRDYVDHKQWTAEEVEKLRKRKQAPVVINRIKTKVNLLTGLERQRRTDPKALPRTPQHEKDADSVTDALRYVQDNTDFPETSSHVFEDKIVWGYGAVIVEVDPDTLEIDIRRIEADRFYFDPHSRRRDFKDAKFMGIVVWMDLEDAVTLFPNKKTELEQAVDGGSELEGDSTYEDQPLWVDTTRKRLRICQHFFLDKGVWHMCFLADRTFLMEPMPSPYVDEFGRPVNPIESETAYIDRENNRYGEVRAYIWAQDEINHRRSKALHMLSNRQTLGDQGVVKDVAEMKQELAKPDGHVELVGGPSRRFEILQTNDMARGQLELYQDAKGDIDSIGANAALSGTADMQGMSGRALQALQQGGLSELGLLYEGHDQWEKRVYRQVWLRIRQFWDEERWVRVTDSEENVRWVGLNRRVTVGDQLMAAAQQGDERAQMALQQMIGDPRLQEVVEIENQMANLDVDIILSKAPDTVTIQQEQFEALSQLARSYGPEAVPFAAMLKLSSMPHKEEVERLLNPPEEEIPPEELERQRQMQESLIQLEFRGKEAAVLKDEAEAEAKRAATAKDLADAEAQALENEIVRQIGITDVTLSVGTGA